MSELSSPRLAAPGAGLPRFELLAARLLFFVQSRRATPELSRVALHRERDMVLARVAGLDDAAASRRVLIRRLPGMEDSSRYWSVFMTMEHLRIVNLAVAEAIRLLGEGRCPATVANTAAVKPAVGVGREVVNEFLISCHEVEAAADRLPDLKTKARYRHPWFGPLRAAEWYFLAGFHLALHRRQIDLIVDGSEVSPT